jgi:hypothetical protein
MVHLALRLWSASRLIGCTWHLCGPERLDMDIVSDCTNPWYGMNPVTPIMDQQLDQIAICQVLVPIKKSLLSQLHEAVHEDSKAKKRWLEIYLTSFVLLHNFSVQLAEERQFARRYGMSVRLMASTHF